MSLDATHLIQENTATSSYGSADEASQNILKRSLTSYKRLGLLCALGILAFLIADLVFLPRTSPNRDFRRWHGLKLTKVDVERLFISLLLPGISDPAGLTTEDYLSASLKNFSDINSKRLTGLTGSLALELLQFVKSRMEELNYDTRVYEYDLPSELQSPISLNLTLYETQGSRKLYTAPLLEPKSLTPAFYAFSRRGVLKKPYIYANSGRPEDFALLTKNHITARDKIIIFQHSLNSDYSLSDKFAFAEEWGCAGVVVCGDEKVPYSISRKYKPLTVPDQKFRLPVSFEAAKPILIALGPPSGDFNHWSFAPYSEYSLELEIRCDFSHDRLKASNIVASMPSALHDGVVVVGASRDTYTSSNAMSGHAVMLEIMRKFNELQNSGWLPLRSINFISWDSSRSCALGSSSALIDSNFNNVFGPVIAYVNLDEDFVTGSHFSIESNPLFNHLFYQVALFVPSPPTLREREWTGTEEGLITDRCAHNHSLLDFWRLQDNATINNKLGYVYGGKDPGTYQMQAQIPTINVKFEHSVTEEDLQYVPESNYYDLEWLGYMDKGYQFHSALVRFIGLLLISLGENEVIDKRIEPYFGKFSEFYQDVLITFKNEISAWGKKNVLEVLKRVSESALAHDLKHKDGGIISFDDILQTFGEAIKRSIAKAKDLDASSRKIQELWTTDFPWFKLTKKLQVIRQYKRVNRDLIQFEESLSGSPVMYEIPKGILPVAEKKKRGAFASLYEAFDDESVEDVVLLLADKYQRLMTFLK